MGLLEAGQGGEDLHLIRYNIVKYVASHDSSSSTSRVKAEVLQRVDKWNCFKQYRLPSVSESPELKSAIRTNLGLSNYPEVNLDFFCEKMMDQQNWGFTSAANVNYQIGVLASLLRDADEQRAAAIQNVVSNPTNVLALRTLLQTSNQSDQASGVK